MNTPQTLRDRIRAIVEPLPAGASVTLPRDALAEWLGADDPEPLTDLTVNEVAELVRRAPSTVRGWCASGELRSYLFQGREYRVTRAALREFQDRQANPVEESGDDDLGSWRHL